VDLFTCIKKLMSSLNGAVKPVSISKSQQAWSIHLQRIKLQFADRSSGHDVSRPLFNHPRSNHHNPSQKTQSPGLAQHTLPFLLPETKPCTCRRSPILALAGIPQHCSPPAKLRIFTPADDSLAEAPSPRLQSRNIANPSCEPACRPASRTMGPGLASGWPFPSFNWPRVPLLLHENNRLAAAPAHPGHRRPTRSPPRAATPGGIAIRQGGRGRGRERRIRRTGKARPRPAGARRQHPPPPFSRSSASTSRSKISLCSRSN
jgi:hypothetical protein